MTRIRFHTMLGIFATAIIAADAGQSRAADRERALSPMRPLPTAREHPVAVGARFVDATKGDDANDGSQQAPWKTLRQALRQLQPADTLYLRGGTYYERPSLSRSGSEEAPITIAAYPGEMAIIDGGLREFVESPEKCWQPLAEGAEGEFVSTNTYFDSADRDAPRQFLPGSWEPLWGLEDERPLALGHFAGSMVPLHGYRTLADLRSTNEYWLGGKDEMRESGIYCGPGLWFNRDTGRIHVRLAHHRLEGLGDCAYRGETDPRRLPLSIAVGFGADVLRICGVKHVRLHDLVLRGATGSPMIHVYGSQHIELDHLTIFGGFPGLLVNASQKITVTNSAFRGLAAPWTSRAHMKYRGTASYQIILRNDQPLNEHIELARCEFTDDHDFAFLRFAKDLQFHHNYVDNFNDDGLECGPKLRDHTLYIWQNRIGACLIPFTQHEIDKDESPLDHDPRAGVFVFRNCVDTRQGTYRSPPGEPDATGSYLKFEGHLVGDHGGPVWPVMHVYHNTLVRRAPTFRGYFLFGLGAQGLRRSERDVFNNLFVQTEGAPGVGFVGIKQAENLREGGNLLWGLTPISKPVDPFAKFRASPLFEQSRDFYPHGWTIDDLAADPKLVALASDTRNTDLRLSPGSPAINAGVQLSADWPDPFRDADRGRPDIGALPHEVDAWRVGVDGRLPLFGP